MQIIGFEKRFSDNSGVEKAVRYNFNNSDIGELEFESNGDKCNFSIDDLIWIIGCLNKIDKELK